MEFIIASHNQKKIREMDAILGALGISAAGGGARTGGNRYDF